MGAGILPTTIYNGKLYFLFAKENRYADTPGYSDFGGGNDDDETFRQTAIREAQEEMCGFIDERDIKKMMNRGSFNIEFNGYKMFMVYMPYNPYLPYFYNNNHALIERKLDPETIQNSKIFEKSYIKWMSVRDMIKNKNKFRSYFKNIVNKIYSEHDNIFKFMKRISGNKDFRTRHRTYKTYKSHKMNKRSSGTRKIKIKLDF